MKVFSEQNNVNLVGKKVRYTDTTTINQSYYPCVGDFGIVLKDRADGDWSVKWDSIGVDQVYNQKRFEVINKEENKMSKNYMPEVAKMLGVEIGEKFNITFNNINITSSEKYFLSKNGIEGDIALKDTLLRQLFCGNVSIIKITTYTAREIEVAKACQVLGATYLRRSFYGQNEISACNVNETITFINENLFQKIKDGERLLISDILKVEQYDAV